MRLQLNNLQRFCPFWCRAALVHPVPTVSVCGADRESFGKSPDFHSCIFQRQLQILLWEKNIIHKCEIVSTLSRFVDKHFKLWIIQMLFGVEGNVGHVSPQGKKNIVQQKTKEFVKLDSYFL